MREIRERNKAQAEQVREADEEEAFLGSDTLREQFNSTTSKEKEKDGGDEEHELFMVRVPVGKLQYHESSVF